MIEMRKKMSSKGTGKKSFLLISFTKKKKFNEIKKSIRSEKLNT